MAKIEYNIYCDESCHLPNDDSDIMVLGAVWCQKDKRRQIFKRIREIKHDNGLDISFELKWNKISPAGTHIYTDFINYFFDNDNLHFRGLVVSDKKQLEHQKFDQDHDTFYYKMYFNLLKVIMRPECAYNIYLDIKDTKSQEKVIKLREVLRSNNFDYQKEIIQNVQHIHSHEVEIIQLTDLLTGSLGYINRGLTGNQGKLDIIDKIKYRSGYSLQSSTLYKEDKFNIFIWTPRNPDVEDC